MLGDRRSYRVEERTKAWETVAGCDLSRLTAWLDRIASSKIGQPWRKRSAGKSPISHPTTSLIAPISLLAAASVDAQDKDWLEGRVERASKLVKFPRKIAQIESGVFAGHIFWLRSIYVVQDVREKTEVRGRKVERTRGLQSFFSRQGRQSKTVRGR